MRPVLSSKFLVPMLTTGPTGMLATAGMKLLRSDLAIARVADGAGATGSLDGGVAEEKVVQDWFSIRSASGFVM